jgi:dephospho-CoA kinase
VSTEPPPLAPSGDPYIRGIRREISDLDRDLVELVNERLRLVAKLKRYKDERGIDFVDLAREEGMLQYLQGANRGPLSAAGLEQLYHDVLELTKHELLALKAGVGSEAAETETQRPPDPADESGPVPRQDGEGRRRRPISVAITGGIGAGKSEALRAFGRRGAATLSSDAIVHELIAHDADVRVALEERLGTTDRAEIASIVFRDRDALVWLEGLLHPRVQERSRAWREGLADLPESPHVSVTEVPLLFEVGGESHFDKVVVITAPKAVRDARRVRMPDDRERELIDDEEKLQRADYVYVNSGSLEELDEFVDRTLRELEDEWAARGIPDDTP